MHIFRKYFKIFDKPYLDTRIERRISLSLEYQSEASPDLTDTYCAHFIWYSTPRFTEHFRFDHFTITEYNTPLLLIDPVIVQTLANSRVFVNDIEMFYQQIKEAGYLAQP